MKDDDVNMNVQNKDGSSEAKSDENSWARLFDNRLPLSDSENYSKRQM